MYKYNMLIILYIGGECGYTLHEIKINYILIALKENWTWDTNFGVKSLQLQPIDIQYVKFDF